MDIPSILFVSCSENLNVNSLMRLFLESELPNGEILAPGITSYPWHITTKYYDTDVNLWSYDDKRMYDDDVELLKQAVVLYFDDINEDYIEKLTEWLPYVNNCEIKLLLCQQCTGASRENIMQWCIKEGFELIELDEEDDVDEANNFRNTLGMKRVHSALHAHVWPNLKMKNLDIDISSILEEDIGDMPDFGDVFGRLQIIKQQAALLPHNERKIFAEKIVRQFWQAMCSDDDELPDDICQDPPNNDQFKTT